MKIIKSLGIIIHTVIFLGIGIALIMLALNLFTTDDIAGAVNYAYAQPNAKFVLGIAGGILVLFGIITAHMNLSKMQREKTIAFENPEGQVTVSLSAIEDFIKKSVRRLPEVKELKANVTASKKGINVLCKATIFADSNIPETTERVQSIVKSKVQEMLGVEETINTKIHVVKISSKGKAEKAEIQPKEYEERDSRRMPFAGTE